MLIKLPRQVSSRQLGLELQGWVRAVDTDLGMTQKHIAFKEDGLNSLQNS